MRELIPHGVALDGATAARKAAIAGVDMDMESNLYGPELPKLVRAGAVPEAVLNEAVRRILRVKFALRICSIVRIATRTSDEQAKSIPPEQPGVGADCGGAIVRVVEERPRKWGCRCCR